MLVRLAAALQVEPVLTALARHPELRVAVPTQLPAYLEQLWYAAQFREGLARQICIEAVADADAEPWQALITICGLLVTRPEDADHEVRSEDELHELLL